MACRGGAREPALLAWEVASCILDSVRPLARIEVVCSARGGSSSHLLQGAGHRQGLSTKYQVFARYSIRRAAWEITYIFSFVVSSKIGSVLI
jgi:hypothetical protein